MIECVYVMHVERSYVVCIPTVTLLSSCPSALRTMCGHHGFKMAAMQRLVALAVLLDFRSQTKADVYLLESGYSLFCWRFMLRVTSVDVDAVVPRSL